MRKLFTLLVVFLSFFIISFLFAPQAHAQVTYGNMAVVTAAYQFKYPDTNSPYLTSVTYCGQPMTKINREDVQTNASEIWRLPNPPAGSCQIVATFSKSVKEKNFTSTILKNVNTAQTNFYVGGVRQNIYVSYPRYYHVENKSHDSIMMCSMVTHPEGGRNLVTPMSPKVIASKAGQLLYHAVGLSIKRGTINNVNSIGLGWISSIGANGVEVCASFDLNPASTLAESVRDSIPSVTPPPVASSTQGISARYFDNPDLTNSKGVVVESAPGVNLSGITAPPGSNLPDMVDTSVRWTGYLRTTFGGTYTFKVAYDDAARIWIQDQLIFDKWTDSGGLVPKYATTNPISLLPNTQYPIRIEYYNKVANAYLNLRWQNLDFMATDMIIPDQQFNTALEGSPAPPIIAPSGSASPTATPTRTPSPTPTPTRSPSPTPTRSPSPTPTRSPSPTPTASPTPAGKVAGLTGKYYNNIDFTTLKHTRVDAYINNNWFLGAPFSDMAPNTYSIRWTGFLKAPTSGFYFFYTQSDDGVRVWLNGNKIIDHWADHTSTQDSTVQGITLVKDQYYPIRVDYKENTGQAVIQLKWSYIGTTTQQQQIIPATYLFH